jgi:DNA polymerase eta
MKVFNETGFTCSAGVSHNKLLAKLASGVNKPNAQTVILNENLEDVLKNFKIGKIRGFGSKIATTLEEKNITTIKQLHEMNLEELEAIFGNQGKAQYIYLRARGYDDEEVKDISKQDFKNKVIFSQKGAVKKKINSLTELEDYLILITSDIYTRLLDFYEETALIPKTIGVFYFDNSTMSHRSKQGEINITIDDKDLRYYLELKAYEIIKVIGKNIFPLDTLGVCVRNFQPSTRKGYAFSLKDYIRSKKNTDPTINEGGDEENSRIHENKNELNLNAEGFDANGDDSKISTLISFPNQDIMTSSPKISNEKKCDICNKYFSSNEFEIHLDYHLACELDKETNPKKRKYQQPKVAAEQDTPIISESSKKQATKKPVGSNNRSIEDFFRRKN